MVRPQAVTQAASTMQHSADQIIYRVQGHLESLQLHHDLGRPSQSGLGQHALRRLACAVVA